MKKLLIVLFALLMISCAPREIVVDIGEIIVPWTLMPEPTDAPTDTPEPTLPPPMDPTDLAGTLEPILETIMPLPPFNEMCWTQRALTSFLEQDFDLKLEWIESEYAEFELWHVEEYDDYTVLQIGINLEKDCETCCITGISITTRTIKEKGDWLFVGQIHGFLSMMTDVEYLFFVEEQFDLCTDTEKNTQATVFTFNGYYSAREVVCFISANQIQLTTYIWNDHSDWIGLNDNVTIEDGNLIIEIEGPAEGEIIIGE